jgi:hypothetical protein
VSIGLFLHCTVPYCILMYKCSSLHNELKYYQKLTLTKIADLPGLYFRVHIVLIGVKMGVVISFFPVEAPFLSGLWIRIRNQDPGFGSRSKKMKIILFSIFFIL